ncbi:MAG: hypothetical protein B6I26_06125 [Desulfobacteraceae bacterium 4572_130]|nr:MAG: hypothetical protein B6I26_06125 [Desulfobacteraceae bacterium 4572_130]
MNNVLTLINNYLTVNGQIAFYWNFYFIAIVGLFTWIANHKKSLTLQTRCAITLGIVIFTLMNFGALQSSYDLYDSIAAQIKHLVSNNKLVLAPEFSHEVNNLGNHWRKFTFCGHILVSTLVLIAFWKIRFRDSLLTENYKLNQKVKIKEEENFYIIVGASVEKDGMILQLKQENGEKIRIEQITNILSI